MQKRKAATAAAIVLAVLATVPHRAWGQAAPAPAPTASSRAAWVSLLAGDKRLAKRVTVSAVGVPLGDLVKEVGDAAGVPLRVDDTTDTSVAARKVQARLNGRSVRLVLESLADLYGASWQKDEATGGFVLVQDPTQTEVGRRWWRLFNTVQRETEDALRQRLLDSMRHPPTIGPEPGAGKVSTITLAMGSEGVFYRSLPPAIQENIAEAALPTTFLPDLQQWEVERRLQMPIPELPPTAQRVMVTVGSPRGTKSRLPPPLPPLEALSVGFSVRDGSIDSSLMLPDGRLAGFPLSLHDSNPDGSVNRNFPLQLLLDSEAGPLAVRQSAMPGAMQCSPSARRLALYETATVWKNASPPEAAAYRATQEAEARRIKARIKGNVFVGIRSRPPSTERPHAADVWNWLADTSQVEFVADYHARPHQTIPLLGVKVLPGLDPATKPQRGVTAELDYRAWQLDYSWKRADSGVYLLRNNRWYRDDVLEVPAPLLRTWETALERPASPIRAADAETGAVPPPFQRDLRAEDFTPSFLRRQLETEADILSHLSTWQILFGLTWYHREPEERADPFRDGTHVKTETALPSTSDAPAARAKTDGAALLRSFPLAWIGQRVLRERYTLLFYRSLSPAGKEDLLRGRLAIESLSPEQRRGAAELARRPQVFTANSAAPPTDGTPRFLRIGPWKQSISTASMTNVPFGVDRGDPLRLFIVEDGSPRR